MEMSEIVEKIIDPGLGLLPAMLDSPKARVMLLTIGLQESRFEYRRQLGNGPARGFWQFERGTQASRGGVWGVYLHPASRMLLQDVCKTRNCAFDPATIWARLETDDLLACAVARLLLLTDAAPLPKVDDEEGAWQCYAKRTWNPGKPHRQTWGAFHDVARAAVGV